MILMSEILHYCEVQQIISHIGRGCKLSHDDSRHYVDKLLKLKMIESKPSEDDYRGNSFNEPTAYIVTAYGIECRSKLDDLLKLFTM